MTELNRLRNPGIEFCRRWALIIAFSSFFFSLSPAAAQTQPEPERPVVVVGGDSNYPPYEFIDENGQAAGFNIDLMQAIGEVMGFDAEYRLGPWNESVAAFRAGEIQVIPMFLSVERAEYADFTERFRTTYHLLFVRQGSRQYEDLDDLAGGDVIVEDGAYAHDQLMHNSHGARIFPADTEPEAMRLLASGEYDCALVTSIGGYYAIKEYGLDNIVSGSPPVMTSDYCFAVLKGDTALLDQLNQGLRVVQATDRFDEIYDLWIGSLEPDEHSLWEIMGMSVWILAPLSVLALLALIWSWVLSSQVTHRTVELVRANRALKTLSECNQAIVKIRNESDLLNTVCGVMTGVGGYRMAWIGLTDDGRYESIRLAAISGVDQEFYNRMFDKDRLAKLDLKPYARSITSGKPVIVRNILSDPGFAPWKGMAVEGGFVSMISLPLIIHDTVIGCFSIYSSESGSFDDVEVELLDELANDIGYGVTAIRTREERNRAVETMLESQKRMSTVFHRSPFGHILARFSDSSIIEVNEAFLNITGFSEQEVNGKTINYFLAQKNDNIWQQFFAGKGKVTDAEIQFRRKDGGAGYGLLTLDVFPVGEVKHIVGFLNDITPRKQAENRIIHLNSVLLGIRNVNQLITREHDRNRIVQEACELLVEARGFQSVCIGLLDESGENISSIAGSGGKLPLMKELLAREELPDCVQKSLATPDIEVRSGNDPSCTICLDPDQTKWRDALIIRLEYEGKIYGFMFCAVPVGTGNDPEEQELLREVAGDIAFALYNIELTEERDAAIQEIESQAKFPSENPNPVMRLAVNGDVMYANDAATRLLSQYDSKALARLLDLIAPIIDRGSPESIDVDWYDQSYIIAVAPVLEAGYVNLYGRNITDRKRLEEQLLQSQKMEAVGQLAGGVAHDFNNMLSIIMGYAELGLELTDKDATLSPILTEIQKAGGKAASLTRQLLAFSRKQVMQPEVFNLNRVITGMQDMLVRLLGEDIDLVTSLAEDLGNVKADPGQTEQVVMNLAINARDAMPTGGKLTIETGNASLDEDYAQQHTTVKPGEYVLLAVSDTGSGMDENVLSRIFEPFFTTKHENRGTGLGLATSYGIVKQSGGNIWVYSEPGAGTTFKIYLPRVEEPAQVHRPVKQRKPLRGSEVILVVEDEEGVRNLAKRILEDSGYAVLSAMNAVEAETACAMYDKPVDLVLTDVVMPGVSGRVLADRLLNIYPKMKVLYMSGYTDNAIVHHGILDAGTHFIGKPFTVVDLLIKVRNVLDETE